MNSAISTSPMMSGGARRMRRVVRGVDDESVRASAAATTSATSGRPGRRRAAGPRPRTSVDQRSRSAAIPARSCSPRAAALPTGRPLDLAEHGVRGARSRAGCRRRWCRAGPGWNRSAAAPKVTRAPIGKPPPMPLATRDRVGHDAGVLEGEPLAGAARAGLDLVDDEQRAVPRGELARGAEVAVGQVDDARLALDRLDEEGRDVGRRWPPRAPRRRRTAMSSTPPGSGRNGSRYAGLPVSASEPIVRPWKESSSARMRVRPAGAAGELERGLVRLGAGVAEEDAPSRRRR